MRKRKYLVLFFAVGTWAAVIILAFIFIKSPSNIIAKYHFWKGLRKQKSGDLQGSIVEYTKAITYDGKYVLAYMNRGGAYLDLREYSKAIADYTVGISFAPTNAKMYAYRGRSYYEDGQYDKAEKDYNYAIEIDKKLAYAYYNRGVLRYTIYKNFQAGCADFSKALDLGYDKAKEVIKNGNCEGVY